MDARLKTLFEFGHHLNPNPRVETDITRLEEIENLVITDAAARNMVASWQEIMGLRVDGELGPITESSLGVERCGFPDYQPAGQGTFDNPCFTDGIKFSYSDRGRPANFSKDLAEKMIANVMRANGEMGAKMIRVDVGDGETIRISWEVLGGSTIGLAQLTNGPCNQRLFCKINPNYARAGIVQMSALLCHEIAHNYGFSHERGGIMSPTIVQLQSFQGWLPSDPAYRVWQRHAYNGFVPIDSPPGPDPDPEEYLRFEVENSQVRVFDGDQPRGTYVGIVKNGNLTEIVPWYSV